MKNKKENFFIVGFGTHARKKLLPALQNLNKRVCGIVSSKHQLNTSIPIFKDIKNASNSINDCTKFIISSPPNIHFSQVKQILNMNKNIYVEKPIFINSFQAKEIDKILINKNVFVTEILMYKYTHLYKSFLKTWSKRKDECVKIECFFNIPEIPNNTFRDDYSLISSPLYDIGCYPLTLLVDLQISLKNLKILHINKKNNKMLNFQIKGIYKQFDIDLEFGIGKEYKNLVSLKFSDEKIIEFDKFFYGIECKKNILIKNKKKCKRITIEDINGFEKIFSYPPSFWKKNQRKRFLNIIKVNNKLMSLKKACKNFSFKEGADEFTN